jgi:LemA protein
MFIDDNLTVVVIIIFAVLLVIFLWAILTRNKFASYIVKIKESDSGIDVALTKRYDTLIKMLDITKGYARHEAEVLSNVVKIRMGLSLLEKESTISQLDELKGKINLLAESYPDLKASQNFRDLSKAVSEAEDHLQAARRIYNMNVSRFNRLLVSWPPSMIGSIMNLSARDFFETDAEKRDDVKMAL